MGKIRIIVGVLFIVAGFIVYVNNVYNNPFDPTNPINVTRFQSGFEIIVGAAIVIGIGAAITGWGIRSYSS